MTEVKKTDFLYFQNEILTDLKQLETKLTSKIEENTNKFFQQIKNSEEKMN